MQVEHIREQGGQEHTGETHEVATDGPVSVRLKTPVTGGVEGLVIVGGGVDSDRLTPCSSGAV